MPCSPSVLQQYGNILTVASISVAPTGSDRYPGRRIFTADFLREYEWDGTGWVIMAEPTQTYTPTLAQGASTNIAKTVNGARYHRHDGWLSLMLDLAATAAGTAASAVTASLPVAAIAASRPIGSGIVYDASAGVTAIQAGQAFLASTQTVAIQPHGSAGGGWGSSPSLALASGDGFTCVLEYEMTTRYS